MKEPHKLLLAFRFCMSLVMVESPSPPIYEDVLLILDGTMAGCCTSVRPYFQKNTAQELPLEDRQLLRMRMRM